MRHDSELDQRRAAAADPASPLLDDIAHRETWLQIPWYVNERIDASLRARLDAHLRDCGACREEHAVLVGLGERFAKDPSVRMLGINYRDTRANAGQFLKKMGAFPYPSAVDPDARTGVDFGVFGLPETFFIDAGGIVRARHIGPLTPTAAETYLALIGAGR